MFGFVADIIVLSLFITGVWSLIAILTRVLVTWEYVVRMIIPLSIFIAVGAKYFKVIEWIEKLTSN